MPDTMLLLSLMDESHNQRSWHGATLRGSLRGVTWAQAAWRPARGRHSIHEIVLHAAYWKYGVRRQLTGERRGSFPLEGSNWIDVPTGGASAWRNSVAVLDEMHRQLRDAVVSLGPAQLHRSPKGSKLTRRYLISGIIAHDLYHAGQIQLLKKLLRGS